MEMPNQAVQEVAQESAEKAQEKVKQSFKEKIKSFFSTSKKQFVNLLPSEQITVMVGALLVFLSIFDHYMVRAVVAIIGMVMIMVAFTGMKLNDIGKKSAKKDPVSTPVVQNTAPQGA